MSEPGRVEFRALGTGCVVMSVDATAIVAAQAAALRELAAVDAACSRFRDDSDLEQVNGHPGTPVAVSTLLLDALDVARRAAQLTDGDLDPTIGTALITLGYDRDFAAIGDAARAAGRVHVRRVRGWQCIAVDRDRRTVSVPKGVRIDLGATAKAWAADRAATAAAGAAGCGVLVSLGGDIAVQGDGPDSGWAVALADRHDAPAAGAPIVTIREGGIATSSTSARRWTSGDTTAHHIIDPATSLPVPDYWRTVTVAAASALDANIASTTCIIRGDRALDWLAEIRLPARLVAANGHVTVVNGWPSDTPCAAVHA